MGFVDHFGHALHIGNLGFTYMNIRTFITDWCDVRRLQPVAFNNKYKTRRKLGSGGLRLYLREDGRKEKPTGRCGGSAEKLSPAIHG